VTLPKPDVVERDLRDIERVLPSIRELYRWSYGWVLSSAGGSALEGGRPGFSDSDPTGELASANAVDLKKSEERELRALRRKTVGKAAGKILAAMEDLYAARNDLEKVVGPLQLQMARKPPRVGADVTQADLTASLEAQRQRRERGEGFG
jgi:hypothetical protein